MSVNPAEMFKSDPKYVKFDQNGVPTHQKSDKPEGEAELPKKVREKLVKDWNKQKVQYEKYLELYASKQENTEASEPKKEQ